MVTRGAGDLNRLTAMRGFNLASSQMGATRRKEKKEMPDAGDTTTPDSAGGTGDSTSPDYPDYGGPDGYYGGGYDDYYYYGPDGGYSYDPYF